jgi:alpha-glucosidase
MAMASREGFLKASPNTRPFLLSRSGFIGTSRYSAVWTGDNMSNEWYLKQSLPMTLNLALSGIPFNGADVCGFVGDTTPALAIAWYKAAFLMPFFRNHCNKGERDQEPWRFGSETMHIIRRYIRLRYKLLPYLYNLFIDQEESGAAIVRPLFYDFDDTKALPLGKIDDQYMLGPSIMHAPVLDSHSESRNIVLPKGNWFDALKGKWISGPQKLEKIGVDRDETPIYIRDGSIIPMLCGEPTDNDSDLSSIECHLFISASHTGAAHYAYRFDDGETFDYKNGKRTAVTIQAEAKDKRFKIDLKNIQTGYKALNMRFVVYGEFSEINLTVGERETTLAIRKKAWKFAGKNLTPKISEPIEIG